MSGYRLWVCLLIAGMLTACSSGSRGPAPVIELHPRGPHGEAIHGSLTGATYTVRKGDTLYSIAYAAGSDYREVARLNGLKAPYVIFPGQLLHLKDSKSVTASTPVNKTARDRKGQQTDNLRVVDRPQGGGYSAQTPKGSRASSAEPAPVRVRWVWPARGRVISGFSAKEHGNKGLDIGGGRGDPVYAAADGKVVYAGSALRGFGNLLIVKHNEDYLSAYAHNQRLLVKEQDWVKAGQQIAEMGDSGTSGVKLHFEIRLRGQSVNPMPYLPGR